MVAAGVEWERVVAMPPGARLATALGALDLAVVPRDRVVDVLQAQHRQSAHEQARLLAAMVKVARTAPAANARGAHPCAAGEIAAALTWTARAADREFEFASTLVLVLPRVFEALLAGHIDRARAWVFADHLDPDACGLAAEQVEALCARLVPLARGWTSGQLAARLLRAIIAIDPDAARRRYDRAVRERAVAGYLDRNGTVTVSAVGLAPDEAAAACERLERLAAAVERAGHPGWLKQIQADLFVAMLDGRYQYRCQDQIIADLLHRSGSWEAESSADTSTEQGTGVDVEADVETCSDSGARTESDADAGSDVDVDARTDSGARTDTESGADVGSDADTGSDADVGSDVEADARSDVDEDEADVGLSPAKVGPRREPGGRSPVTSRVGIEIRIGLSTLIGLDSLPGEIPGFGPVGAHVARTAVHNQRRGSQWRFAVTDAEGYLILAGVTRCRPEASAPRGVDDVHSQGGVVELHVPAAWLDELSATAAGGPWAAVVADIAAQYARRESVLARLDGRPTDRYARGVLARHVQIRDRTCCHPGCRRPARKSDLDHTRDYSVGGPTTQRNIAACCARHHLYKHELGWALRQREPGHFEWTSPLGRRYRTRGEPISAPPAAPSYRRTARRPENVCHPPDDESIILRLPPPEPAPQPPPAAHAPGGGSDTPPF